MGTKSEGADIEQKRVLDGRFGVSFQENATAFSESEVAARSLIFQKVMFILHNLQVINQILDNNMANKDLWGNVMWIRLMRILAVLKVAAHEGGAEGGVVEIKFPRLSSGQHVPFAWQRKNAQSRQAVVTMRTHE
jgi:hypothetical protein